jgi:hypothetical protein
MTQKLLQRGNRHAVVDQHRDIGSEGGALPRDRCTFPLVVVRARQLHASWRADPDRRVIPVSGSPIGPNCLVKQAMLDQAILLADEEFQIQHLVFDV